MKEWMRVPTVNGKYSIFYCCKVINEIVGYFCAAHWLESNVERRPSRYRSMNRVLAERNKSIFNQKEFDVIVNWLPYDAVRDIIQHEVISDTPTANTRHRRKQSFFPVNFGAMAMWCVSFFTAAELHDKCQSSDPKRSLLLLTSIVYPSILLICDTRNLFGVPFTLAHTVGCDTRPPHVLATATKAKMTDGTKSRVTEVTERVNENERRFTQSAFCETFCRRKRHCVGWRSNEME